VTGAGSRRISARCVACGGVVAQSHRFCPHCGSPLNTLPGPTATDRRTTLVGPSLQASTERADALEEQRKLVTVMFIDLAGSTPLAERLDPEEWRGMLARYFSVLSKHIVYHGGTIDKYIGDAVMAVFGAPIAREDDPLRAITAALAIKAEMAQQNDDLEKRYGARLTLRLGINTGEVVAGLLAGGAEGAYTITGDTVNTAQRFESAAPHNEILVGEGTYQAARKAFVFESLPPLTLKGKSEPVPAYRVIGRERRSVPRENIPPLIGRDAELGLLRARFSDAASGRGRVLNVSGEPGVGKSRLLHELFAGLPHNVTRLRPRCTSFESTTPYALVADMFRRGFGIQQTDEEPVARAAVNAALDSLAMPKEQEGSVALLLEVLGYAQRSILDPETKRRILVSLVRLFLTRKSAKTPLVVVAEDLHWIDSASASLFAEVVPGLGSLACLFISTSRDEAVPWPAESLPLRALDTAAAVELLEILGAGELDPQTRETLLERTGGNPFFMEEIVRSLGGRTSGKVPANIHELLQARLDDLSPTAKRVAQRASIIGRFFTLRLLSELTHEEALDVAVAELERQGFVSLRSSTPDLTYAFRHSLLQESVYQVQLIAQRRMQHGQVGAAVEALYAGRLDEFVDVLAFQYGRSDNDDKAVDWQVRAGDRAKRLFANTEAISLYTAALERVRESAPFTAPSILERVGDVQTLTGRFEEAIATLGSAESRLGVRDEPTALARLRRKSGVALRVKGAQTEAAVAFQRALSALRDPSTAEAARIRLEMGQLAWRSGDYQAAREDLAAAVQAASALNADEVVADGLRQLGNIEFLGGDPNEAVKYYERSSALYERLDDLVGLATVRTNLGGAWGRLGRWDEALERFRAALSLHERTGNLWMAAITHNNMGELYRLSGRPAEAVAAFERALVLAEQMGYAAGVALALTGRGASRVDLGEPDLGRADLLEAELRFTALGRTVWFPDLYRLLASAELARGDLEAARKAADRAIEYARAGKARHQEAMSQRVLGEIALARGDVEEARDLLERSRVTLAEVHEAAELQRTEEVLRRLPNVLGVR
jgi:adenylate cyclase